MIKQLHLNNLDYFFWEIEFEIDNYLGKLPCGQPNEHCFKHKTLVLSQGGEILDLLQACKKDDAIILYASFIIHFAALYDGVHHILFS